MNYEFYNHPRYGDTDRKLELQYSITLTTLDSPLIMQKSYNFLLKI